MAIDSIPAVAPVRRLDELTRADSQYAGAEGADLGELCRAGFPIPPGFVVGVPAFVACCEERGLRALLAERLARFDPGDPDELASAAADARGMIEHEPMPGWLADAIRTAYAELTDRGDVAVVVHSLAATAMNETVLNVRGGDRVVAAVRRCWASLFSAPAIHYRAERGAGPADANSAVLVQRQVTATRAGVMFTSDPATGNPDAVVIEAVPGLDELVPSRSVPTDRYVVDKLVLGIVARDGLGLDDEKLRRLADLGRSVEHHYCTPQEIDWAFEADGSLWLLQSRAMTKRSTGAAP
jgi:phosphoenolpyruvate synthase/pyruvate phosphate dikinase